MSMTLPYPPRPITETARRAAGSAGSLNAFPPLVATRMSSAVFFDAAWLLDDEEPLCDPAPAFAKAFLDPKTIQFITLLKRVPLDLWLAADAVLTALEQLAADADESFDLDLALRGEAEAEAKEGDALLLLLLFEEVAAAPLTASSSHLLLLESPASPLPMLVHTVERYEVPSANHPAKTRSIVPACLPSEGRSSGDVEK
mmetsp:Transcript_9224/g.18144  ORF Transcript_9224/g.18144 Transcript_9224/m.18144 type:complete len:200 (+) Transcript_9224:1537-2136(+)